MIGKLSLNILLRALLTYIVIDFAIFFSNNNTCKALSFTDNNPIFYRCRNPEPGFEIETHLPLTPGKTNFDYYEGCINEYGFSQNLNAVFIANDYLIDRNKRHIECEYYLFDADFLPLNGEKIPYNGELKSDYILKDDYLYYRIGDPYTNCVCSWNQNNIAINFDNTIISLNPAYIRIRIDLSWFVRDNVYFGFISFKTGPIWSSCYEIIYRL